MTETMKEVTLDNIAGGVALELFQREIKKVAENIFDQNTKAKAKRSITLTFSFAPDDAREEVEVSVACSGKLAPVRDYTKTVWCGKKNGLPSIFGMDQKQINLFDESVEDIAQLRPNVERGANA